MFHIESEFIVQTKAEMKNEATCVRKNMSQTLNDVAMALKILLETLECQKSKKKQLRSLIFKQFHD